MKQAYVVQHIRLLVLVPRSLEEESCARGESKCEGTYYRERARIVVAVDEQQGPDGDERRGEEPAGGRVHDGQRTPRDEFVALDVLEVLRLDRREDDQADEQLGDQRRGSGDTARS